MLSPLFVKFSYQQFMSENYLEINPTPIFVLAWNTSMVVMLLAYFKCIVLYICNHSYITLFLLNHLMH